MGRDEAACFQPALALDAILGEQVFLLRHLQFVELDAQALLGFAVRQLVEIRVLREIDSVANRHVGLIHEQGHFGGLRIDIRGRQFENGDFLDPIPDFERRGGIFNGRASTWASGESVTARTTLKAASRTAAAASGKLARGKALHAFDHLRRQLAAVIRHHLTNAVLHLRGQGFDFNACRKSRRRRCGLLRFRESRFRILKHRAVGRFRGRQSFLDFQPGNDVVDDIRAEEFLEIQPREAHLLTGVVQLGHVGVQLNFVCRPAFDETRLGGFHRDLLA